jgi:tetratricopeptide (TPR) repeat protein
MEIRLVSEEHIDAAEQLYQKTGRASALADLIVNRGNLYNMMQRYNDAILCANQAHERFVRLKSSWGIASAQRCLAEAFLGLQQLDEAERAAQQVLATEDEHTRPDGLRVLAEVALLKGDMDSAEQFARDSIASAEEFTNQYLEGYGYRTLGKVYSAQQQLQNAQQAFTKAITIFNVLGLQKEIDDTHVLMDTSSSSE